MSAYDNNVKRLALRVVRVRKFATTKVVTTFLS